MSHHPFKSLTCGCAFLRVPQLVLSVVPEDLQTSPLLACVQHASFSLAHCSSSPFWTCLLPLRALFGDFGGSFCVATWLALISSISVLRAVHIALSVFNSLSCSALMAIGLSSTSPTDVAPVEVKVLLTCMGSSAVPWVRAGLGLNSRTARFVERRCLLCVTHKRPLRPSSSGFGTHCTVPLQVSRVWRNSSACAPMIHVDDVVATRNTTEDISITSFSTWRTFGSYFDDSSVKHHKKICEAYRSFLTLNPVQK